jgi:hypothetical protein
LKEQRIPRRVIFSEKSMGSDQKHQRNMKQLIKAVEDRDVLLRNAGMRDNDQKNVQASKSKRKKLK